MKEKTLLWVDTRRRVSLGVLAKFGPLYGHYLASVDEDGTIELRPAVVMTVERSHALRKAEKILQASRDRLFDEPPF